MNKVLYAREGARSIMDRTFADLPWQVRVEVDGVEIEVPEVRAQHLIYSIDLLFSMLIKLLIFWYLKYFLAS